MFYSEQQAVDVCTGEPSLIFGLIKRCNFDIVEKLLDTNKINVNTCEGAGNDVVTRLLKAKQYELVLKFMKKRNWDVNHQNVEGNTFGHILALDNSVGALKVVEQLKKKKNFIPNIKNNKGETILDKAISNSYIYTAFKILEDKRFNDIDLVTFKRLCHMCVENTSYGKYSRLNNLEVIVEHLEKKNLDGYMSKLLDVIRENMDMIKVDILRDRYSVLEGIINSMTEATNE